MTLLKQLISQSMHVLKLPVRVPFRLISTHVFRGVIPWKNAKSLANYLAENVIFNERGLVVINKPYGVGSSMKSNSKQYLNAAPVGDHVFCLYDALPYLAEKLKYKELFLASVPERYTSGVTVLTTSPFYKKKVKDCVQLSKISNSTMNQYYVVVVGSPQSASGSFNFGITMSSKLPTQPILVPVTNTALRKQAMHSVRVVYSTLSSSNLACLLAIRISTAKLNAVRIVCTDKFISPILGDNMFGSRVKSVLGRDALVGFNEESIKRPQTLKTQVLEALELTAGEELIVPTHQHLHEVYLAKYLGLDIVLRAPVPPVMQWSCKKLGLEVPDYKPCESLFRKAVLAQRKAADEPRVPQGPEEHIEIGVSTQ